MEYTCGTAIDWLARAEQEPALLSFERLNAEYFAAPSSAALPVPMNDVMFATFGLAFLDIAYRIGNWLRGQSIDWQRAMVLVSGQSGRPTAGATWASNNMCYLVWRASERKLPPDRILVAPHAPSFSVAGLADSSGLAELERTYRSLWLNTRSSIDVARVAVSRSARLSRRTRARRRHAAHHFTRRPRRHRRAASPHHGRSRRNCCRIALPITSSISFMRTAISRKTWRFPVSPMCRIRTW